MISATHNEPPDEVEVSMISHIENLIRSSSFDHETQARMERELNHMTREELMEAEIVLLHNQLDPIKERGLFSPTDIKKMII